MALVVMTWAYLLKSGVDGLLGIRDRHVPGYPVPEQVILYAGIPATVLVALLTAAVLSRKVHWFYNVYPVVTALAAFLFLPVLLVWGGGV
jgi:hypothetical protein